MNDLFSSNLQSIPQILIRNWRFLMPFNKKIGYIGWQGHDNLGDEAMFLAFKKIFHNFSVLPFKYTWKVEKFEKILSNNLFAATFLGGGTLINGHLIEDFKLAQIKYSPSFVLGAGVRNPTFWDILEPGKNRINEWVECLKKCSFVGVRGPLSKQILTDGGLYTAEITGDPALCLAKENINIKKGRKKVGINIGVSNGKVWGSEEEILKFIVKFAKIMKDKGWDITFLPVWAEDVAYIEEARKQIGGSISIFYEFSSIKSTMRLLESFDLFVGEKLHSVILAMCTYTPSIMLEYRPKCLDFMMSMGLERFNMRTNNLSLDLILDLTDELCENLDFYQNKIYEKVQYFKKIQHEKAELISEMILKFDSSK